MKKIIENNIAVKLVTFYLKLQINKIKFEMLKCIFEINEIDEIFKKNSFLLISKYVLLY